MDLESKIERLQNNRASSDGIIILVTDDIPVP